MEPAALGALRNYATARQALTPDAAPAKPAAPAQAGPATEAKSQAAPRAVAEFAEIFSQAENAAQAVSVGKADPHSVVEALATAEVALEAAVTVRNKVVEAYQELLRMPV